MQLANLVTIVEAVANRQTELEERLSAATTAELLAPSVLPGWSRLTVACHLRYGAEASHAITGEALAGRPAAFYPAGRSKQRPMTLLPRAGEEPQDVIASSVSASARLNRRWTSLDESDWKLDVHEPIGRPDLGTIPLGMFAVLRLTEVEVHGTDLDIGARPWSNVFVETALPMRLRWLRNRRSNQTEEAELRGVWALRPTDGPPWTISLGPDGVAVHEESATKAEVEIGGTNRQLLAWLLGRYSTSDLRITGEPAMAELFLQAFPPP